MSIVHPFPQNGPAAFACAQAGCRVCLDNLMRRNEGLIHHILRRQFRGDALYDDLVQEGRIGLWKAILRFDPHRGAAFSTYAGVAIQRHIWKAAKPARTPAIESSGDEAPDAQELAEDRVWDEAVRTALHKAVLLLSERLRQVICAAYGLDGAPACTLDVIGQHLSVTGEMVRQLRNNALVLLRLPAFSARLRRLCDQDSRAAYVRTQALSRAWQLSQRGRR